MEGESEDDLDTRAMFQAQPADDLPRNKLVERLARGLQSYVQRMQKRESFFVELAENSMTGWLPAPREYSTLVPIGNKCYLFGGQNYDTNKEIACVTVSNAFHLKDGLSNWKNEPFTTQNIDMDRLYGRCRHSTCVYKNQILLFGGCFMYNRKRQVRESTN